MEISVDEMSVGNNDKMYIGDSDVKTTYEILSSLDPTQDWDDEDGIFIDKRTVAFVQLQLLRVKYTKSGPTTGLQRQLNSGKP